MLIEKNREFIKTLFAISIPIAFQNLIASSLNAVDTVMIGQLGETEIASVGLANQYFFIFVLLLFGTSSGTSVFTSQFWGKKDYTSIKQTLSISMVIGVFFSLVFLVLAFAFPKFILSVFSTDPEVIEIGAGYLRIVSLSYVFTAITISYSAGMRSTGNAKAPMFISGFSLILNTIFNYVFIFGFWIIPAMGTNGAAIGTLLARICETIFIVNYVRNNYQVLLLNKLEYFKVPVIFIKRIMKTSLPVIINEFLYSLGVTLYSVAYGRISTEAIAAVQIAMTVQRIFMVMSMGFGNASAIMLGNELGAGNKERAIDYSKKFSIIVTLSGLLFGVLMFITAPLVVNLFNVEKEVMENTILILRVFGIFMPIKFFAVTLIIGILRSGGDTVYSMLLESSAIWLFGVPMAFLGGHFLGLPIHIVVALVSCEEIIKGAIGFKRVLSNKWVKNLV